MKKPRLSTLKTIITYTAPVFAGYVFLGIAFGLLMRTKGFAVWVPIAMSAIIYSGALEFAAVPILSTAFNPASAFLMGFMVSARHLFYGIPMLKKYKGMGPAKIPLILGLTDETFSINTTIDPPEGISKKTFYLGISLFDYSYWVGGTALGAVLGDILNADLEGIDFALTALFIVLFLEQVRTKRGLKSGILGLASTASVLALFGSDQLVIIAMLVIFILLIALKNFIVGKGNEPEDGGNEPDVDVSDGIDEVNDIISYNGAEPDDGGDL